MISLSLPKRPLRVLRLFQGGHGEILLLAGLVMFVGLLSVAPLLRLAHAALMPDGRLDIARIGDVLGGRRVWQATGNTIVIALAATVVSCIAGTAAALMTALSDFRGRILWVFGFVLPLMLPPQVIALAWIQAFSPSSPVLGAVGLALPPGARHPLYSMTGIVVLLGLYNAPLVFLSVRASLQRIPADLVDAARASGAGSVRQVRDIILPLARGGLFAGAALAFVSAIGNFGIQAMLGIPARIPTLITVIYQRLNSYGPSALNDMALFALLLAGVTIAGMTATSWFGTRADQRVDPSRRLGRMALGRWHGVVAGVAWCYLAVWLILPLTSLFAAAFVRGYGQPLGLDTITFDNFTDALFRHQGIRTAFGTSLWLTLLSVAILIPVAVALGYILSWRNGHVAKILTLFSELAYALPGIIIGVAMILFFLRPIAGVSIYGTVWVILAAYLSNYLALALRPIMGGYAQVDRGLDEAAQLTGAGIFRRLRDIILPSVAPAAMASGILIFMTAINEIQISVLLVSSRAQTIGPMIVFLEEAGSSTLAAAVGCLMVLVVLALMLISLLFAHRLPKGVLPWHD